MLEIANKRILVLAPHTDDAELGMGGTIAKLIANGNEVHCAAFSACRQSVIEGFPEDILITEVKAASVALGVNPEHLYLYEFEVRTFNHHRQAILDALIKLREQVKPDLIFIPSLHDVHQDHKVIAEEAQRAFKFNTLLSYELPWNNFTFTNSCFIILDEKHIDKKAEAIQCYKSQAHRLYTNPQYTRSLAHSRGVQINSHFAECFEIVRVIF